MTRLGHWKRAWAALLFFAATAMASHAQAFTKLADFEYSNGLWPWTMNLVQGTDGNLYGTTQYGGSGFEPVGTVFKITPAGVLTTVRSFCGAYDCTDGATPYSGLVLGTDGNFYGTTLEGGMYGYGEVYRLTPNGELQSLYNFPGSVALPWAAVVEGTDGDFYGTATEGYDGDPLFRLTPSGDFTLLDYFCNSPNCSPGGEPRGALIEGSDGDLYGTMAIGGNLGCGYQGYGCGTIFKTTKSGAVATLYEFSGVDGAFPTGTLVQALDGNFYGTTEASPGTVFRITPGGKLKTLHSFCSRPFCKDGHQPWAGLIQATDGNLYGTAYRGGNASSNGTIFRIAQNGRFTVLHSFDGPDGAQPYGGLLQATNGVLYGTTYIGGDLNCDAPNGGCGTVFSLDVGLGPFAKAVRGVAKVGQQEGILGQGFIGTTAVLFNGTPAKFRVVSDHLLRVSVPAGATTGFISVAIPGGSLKSDKPFRVTPQLLNFDPPSGPVGTQVTIGGVSLTQTSGVGFGDRIPAPFTVNSDTQVTATVPQGAKTGRIGIETKGGVAISSGAFTVTP